jgi:Molybdopterin oxidoreductase Fe4S4 domain
MPVPKDIVPMTATATIDTRRINGFCGLCIARCGTVATVATVENGRFTRLDPDPTHPTGAALCAKGRALSAKIGTTSEPFAIAGIYARIATDEFEGAEKGPRVAATDRTITGHIDFLQLRNGAVHVLDLYAAVVVKRRLASQIVSLVRPHRRLSLAPTAGC